MNKQILKCGNTEQEHETIKCRGIKTKLERVNEEKPITVKNSKPKSLKPKLLPHKNCNDAHCVVCANYINRLDSWRSKQ